MKNNPSVNSPSYNAVIAAKQLEQAARTLRRIGKHLERGGKVPLSYAVGVEATMNVVLARLSALKSEMRVSGLNPKL